MCTEKKRGYRSPSVAISKGSCSTASTGAAGLPAAHTTEKKWIVELPGSPIGDHSTLMESGEIFPDDSWRENRGWCLNLWGLSYGIGSTSFDRNCKILRKSNFSL